MPDDTVKLGGDASQLVRELERAATAWNKYNQLLVKNAEIAGVVLKSSREAVTIVKEYTRSLKAEETGQKNLNAALDQTDRALKKVTSSTNALKNANGTALSQVELMQRGLREIGLRANRSQKDVNKLVLGFRNMSRLVGVQLAHRAISALARGIREGVREAIEIQKGLAEVRTISQENQLAIAEWREGVVSLSDAYGTDLRDQIESAYQTLSNQVAEGAETFQFLAESNKFATAAVASSSDAVQLLTGALNAYGLEADQTGRVAAQFFKTIELGRVRASEMANSIGDVAIIANQLGVELDVLQASIATLTIRGVAYNKAATQLRGIFNKLLKPTEAMKEFFREIGVESGEAAVKTFGFDGVLQKLGESTKGSATELAKYINRIRGLSGGLVLTNEGLEELRNNIDEVRNASKSYEAAVDEVLNSSGKRSEIFLQTVKNNFLEVGLDIVDFWTTWGAESTNFFKRAEEERERLLARNTAEREAQELNSAYTTALDERLRLYNVEVAKYNQVVNKQVDAAVEAYTTIQETALRTNNRIFEDLDDSVSRSNKLFNQLTKDVASAQKEIISLAREEDELLFEWSQDTRNTVEQIQAISERIRSLQVKQTKALEEGNKSAIDSFGRSIRKLFSERFKLDKTLNDENEKSREKELDLNQKIAKVQGDAARQQADFERRLRGAKPQERDKIQRQIFELTRKTAEELTKLRKEQSEIVILGQVNIDHASEVSKEYARQVKIYEELIVKQKESAKVEERKILQQEILREKFKTLFKDFEAFDLAEAVTETDPERLRQVVAQRQELIKKILTLSEDAGIDVGQFIDVQKAVGEESSLLLQRVQLIEQQTAARNQLTSATERQVTAFKELTKAQSDQKAIVDKLPKLFAALSAELDFIGGFPATELDEASSFAYLRGVREATEGVRIANASQARKLEEVLRETIAFSSRLETPDRLDVGQSLDEIVRITQQLAIQLRDYQEREKTLQRVKENQEAIDAIVSKASEGLKKSTQEIKTQETELEDVKTTTEELIQQNEKLLELYKRQTEELKRGNPAPVATAPVQQAFGGVMRGSDSLLALRNPEEAVVNAPNTRKFFSQLVAMNGTPQAVVQPASAGNTTFGNINVTMNAVNPSYDAAQLGREIKRAARRGLV